ncbi:hypothetical protein KP509_03G103100 [Ceratopteris richardii]|uniref:CBS domain-containing protein n=1 Tax=Ceratopteris richardii TaxID=49495 RepID=A0A8T2VE86_CERRI|nr:hypothetical protein KP509_03G103100 [Ceratopteris richardii]
MEEARYLLKSTPIDALLEDKGELLKVQYMTAVGEALQIMRQHQVPSLPVAVPVESESQEYPNICGAGEDVKNHRDNDLNELQAAAHKRFVGFLTMLDILVYLGSKGPEVAKELSKTPVCSILEFCGEGQRGIAVMSPKTSVLEAIDCMAAGVQEALVPNANCICFDSGEEQETSRRKPGAEDGYSVIRQSHLIHFLYSQRQKLQAVLSQSVETLNVYSTCTFGVLQNTSVTTTLRLMQRNQLSVVPIVDCFEDFQHVRVGEIHEATGKAIAGSFSVNSLKECPLEAVSQWAGEGILVFVKKMNMMRLTGISLETINADEDAAYETNLLVEVSQFSMVTCHKDTSLSDVMKEALENDVSEVWVVDRQAIMVGLITFSYIFSALRNAVS